MKWLFTGLSFIDMAGRARAIGAMNGLSKADKHPEFSTLLDSKEFKKTKSGPTSYLSMDNMKTAIDWADAVCDLSGSCKKPMEKKPLIEMVRKAGKPFAWMCHSFDEDFPDELLRGTVNIARGYRAADAVKKLTGVFPAIATDMSVLVDPVKWAEEPYDRVYVTGPNHVEKDKESYKNERSIQIVWDKRIEKKLPITQFDGSVEEAFGLIQATKKVYAARYVPISAGMLFDREVHIERHMDESIEDLIDFGGFNQTDLKNHALIAVEEIKRYMTRQGVRFPKK